MKKLLAASALLAISGAANAAIYNATLDTITLGSSNGVSTLTQFAVPAFQYDSDTGELSSSGLLSVGAFVGITPLFTHNINDLNIVGGSAGGSTDFECVEGVFGGVVGANICGNYTFGANFLDDSTLTYSGLTVTRILGGDDVASGAAQSIDDYNLVLASFDGSTLVLQNADWSPTNGIQMTFSTAVIPVPAAVWLFGSALGLMGLARRRLAA